VKTKRIALSMKALMEAVPKPQAQKPQAQKPQPPKAAEKPPMSVEQKLSALSSKWKVR
jgi:protein Tex